MFGVEPAQAWDRFVSDDPTTKKVNALFPPRNDVAAGLRADVQLDLGIWELVPGVRFDLFGSGPTSKIAVDPRIASRLRVAKLVHVIGSVRLGDSCLTYTEPDYDRVLDVPTKSQQKLSITYAIGTCSFGFRVMPPSTDALLGDGVTEDDKTMSTLRPRCASRRSRTRIATATVGSRSTS